MNTANFVRESNLIEGILREPTIEEINEHDRFVRLPIIAIDDLVRFVSVYQPEALLRTELGMTVNVGHYVPPPGGVAIGLKLDALLDDSESMTPYELHVEYELLHPFTDCNGRSGRALWAWSMMQSVGGYPLGFLSHFYRQALSFEGDRR